MNKIAARISISVSQVCLLATVLLWTTTSHNFVAQAIDCYECDSFYNFTCNEIWDSELQINSVYLSNCSHVSQAKYCIKMTGIYQVFKKSLPTHICSPLYVVYCYNEVELVANCVVFSGKNGGKTFVLLKGLGKLL